MGLFDFLKKKEFEEIKQLKDQLEKYKPISDIEKVAANKKSELEQYISQKEAELNNIIAQKTGEAKGIENNITELNTNYQEALSTYTKLRKEVSLFESKLDLIEFGIYEPVYDFEKSDDYRVEQFRIREKQKTLISLDQAAICDTPGLSKTVKQKVGLLLIDSKN